LRAALFACAACAGRQTQTHCGTRAQQHQQQQTIQQYQPRALDKFELHRGIADNLRKLVRCFLKGGRGEQTRDGRKEERRQEEPLYITTHTHLPHARPKITKVATGDTPHTLFYGPPGAGKRTLVMALLREIYGPGAEKVMLRLCLCCVYVQLD
jgi:DNA-binding NtrC family response regulator